VFFAVMYLYSPLLTLIVALTIPIYVAISVFITPPLRARLDEKFKRGAENQSFLVETVTGIGTPKSMAVEPRMRDRCEKQFAGYIQTGWDVTVLSNWGSHLIQLASKLTTVAILFFGAQAVIAGDLSIGSLVAFNMLSGRVAQPILRLSQQWQDFQQVRISVDRLVDILNSPAEPEHNPNRATLPPIKGRVEFDKVRFRYRPDAPEALRGLENVVLTDIDVRLAFTAKDYEVHSGFGEIRGKGGDDIVLYTGARRRGNSRSRRRLRRRLGRLHSGRQGDHGRGSRT
jgi:subfamily B ATP-binding cassette protein HlyB/CyaB